MKIGFEIEELRKAGEHRPPGYLDKCLAWGERQGDMVFFESEIFDALRREYGSPRVGLGDLVAKVAQPVAVALDSLLGTNLKNCGSCADRRAALNKFSLTR